MFAPAARCCDDVTNVGHRIIGLVGVGFYAGNIYGGINAVRNYNYYESEKYLEKIITNVTNKIELDE